MQSTVSRRWSKRDGKRALRKPQACTALGLHKNRITAVLQQLGYHED